MTWDDHEFENNYAGDRRRGSLPYRTSFLRRRAAAYQAYYEAMPLRRRSLPTGPDMLLYRTRPVRPAWPSSACSTPASTAPTSRTADGEQADAATAALRPARHACSARRRSAGCSTRLDDVEATWNVLAQQVMMAELDHRSQGRRRGFWQTPGTPTRRPGAGFSSTLPADRIQKPVVITGDWHSTFVNDLKIDFDDPDSRDGRDGVRRDLRHLQRRWHRLRPVLRSDDPRQPAHQVLRRRPPGLRALPGHAGTVGTDLRMVSTVSRSDAPVSTFASFVVESGVPGAQLVTGPTSSLRAAPPADPADRQVARRARRQG